MTYGANMQWFIPLLYFLSFSGLAYAFMAVLREGAESYRTAVSGRASRDLADLFYFIPPERIGEIAWTAAAVLFLLFFLMASSFNTAYGVGQGVLAGLLAAGLVLASPHFVIRWLRARRLHKFNDQLVDALMTMSGALKAGSSINQAIEHVVRQSAPPISHEFGFFLHQVRVGVKFEEALRNLEKSVGSEDLCLMVCAIEIARQTGGNLADVFEKISATIRERTRIQARIRALTSQGRMQGIVIGLMPVALALVMLVIEPGLMKAFFSSFAGVAATAVVILMEIAGGLIIRKIINIDV